FISDIQAQVNDEYLIGIFNELRGFMLVGNYNAIEKAAELINILMDNKLSTYQTDIFWHLKHLAICIETIIDNSIWNNLSDVFSTNYLEQLIKSKPSVLELWPNQRAVVNNPEG
ncbi:hypothetical protein, partial [Acinetobacter sp. AGC35]